jgi:hypothetical protein
MRNSPQFKHASTPYVLSGFRRNANEIFVPLGGYGAFTGSYRRFGTTYQSHFRGSSSPRRIILGLIDVTSPKSEDVKSVYCLGIGSAAL